MVYDSTCFHPSRVLNMTPSPRCSIIGLILVETTQFGILASFNAYHGREVVDGLNEVVGAIAVVRVDTLQICLEEFQADTFFLWMVVLGS